MKQILLLIIGLWLLFPMNQTANNKILHISVRNAHAMAYDLTTGCVLLFGGADASHVCGDTWKWDGKSWKWANESGPEPRTFPAMVSDSTRKRIILFGGNRVLFGETPNENTLLNDTWEWNGENWIRINTSSPAPRCESAVAFDSSRGRVVLFGGYNYRAATRNRLGDTWEWDGRKWTQINVPGPSPRNGAAGVYDAARRKVVLFGGATDEGVSGETWEWNGTQWLENRSAAIEGRFNSVMAYDETAKKTIRFGGRFGGKPMGDTWQYDGIEWKKRTSDGPSPRNHTAMVYDSKRKRIVLYGGHDFGLHEDSSNILGDTWEWNGQRWLLIENANAEKRIENNH